MNKNRNRSFKKNGFLNGFCSYNSSESLSFPRIPIGLGQPHSRLPGHVNELVKLGGIVREVLGSMLQRNCGWLAKSNISQQM